MEEGFTKDLLAEGRELLQNQGGYPYRVEYALHAASDGEKIDERQAGFNTPLEAIQVLTTIQANLIIKPGRAGSLKMIHTLADGTEEEVCRVRVREWPNAQSS